MSTTHATLTPEQHWETHFKEQLAEPSKQNRFLNSSHLRDKCGTLAKQPQWNLAQDKSAPRKTRESPKTSNSAPKQPVTYGDLWPQNLLLLVVSTHLKNMLVKLDHLPKIRGENEKSLSCHHPVLRLGIFSMSHSNCWSLHRFWGQHPRWSLPSHIDVHGCKTGRGWIEGNDAEVRVAGTPRGKIL